MDDLLIKNSDIQRHERSTRNFDLNLVCPNTQGKPREGEPLRTEKLRG